MRYPAILQHSEEDCGAACLASIAQYHGRRLSMSRLREAVGTGQTGTTLLGLRRGAETIGFKTHAVQASDQLLAQLDHAPLPAVLHWRGCHWVVLYGKQGKRYVIHDPSVGLRRVTLEQLMKGWQDRIMLLLEVEEARFYAQANDRPQGNLAKLLQRSLTHRSLLLKVSLLNAFIGILSLGLPLLVQILTDDVLVRKDQHMLTTVMAGVVVLTLVSQLLDLIQSMLIAHFARRLELGLSLDFVRQLLQLPLSYFDRHRSGEVSSRLFDVQQVNRLVANAIVSLPSQFFIALVSLTLMVFYSAKLTAIALVLLALTILPVKLFWPKVAAANRQALLMDAENQGMLVETFRGALTFKSLGAETQLWDELQSRFSGQANLAYNRSRWAIWNRTLGRSLSTLGNLVLLWLGSSEVLAGQMTVGQLLAFNSMAYATGGFVSQMLGFMDDLAYTQAAAQRLAEVTEARPEMETDDQRNWVRLSGDGDIVCADLNFFHVGRRELLRDLSLRIPGGKVTALVGPSGCGKSSLVKLLAGLYPPTSGQIRFGPYGQKDLTLPCLRQQVVLVPQDAHLWQRTIVENFRMGAPHVSFEEMVWACQITGADEFIQRLPDTYQTVVGEFGTNLSGGQRQRLAIARALLCDPPILILDESTSALDPTSEAEILTRVFQLRQGKTTILISHRPSVIQRADWIILLDPSLATNGPIEGRPEELKNRPGPHSSFLAAY